MDRVTLAFATELGQIYTDHQVNVDKDEDDAETNLPALKGGTNWIEY